MTAQGAPDYASLAECIHATDKVFPHAGNPFSIHSNSENSLNLESLCGILELSPADQVVKVGAATSISALKGLLQPSGHTLPVRSPLHEYETWTLAEAIDFNLPHLLEAQCGNWRDWILGMTLLRADGTIAKCGSGVVKNVAGYDFQKLMIGARGTLAMILDVTLRTFPVASLPEANATLKEVRPQANYWIQRTLRSDFQRALERASGRVFAADRASCTLWAEVAPDDELPRYPCDWLIRSHAGEKNLDVEGSTLVKYMKRAKDILDPDGKLNPGEMGIF